MATMRCARSISPISPVSPVIRPVSPISDISSIGLGDSEDTGIGNSHDPQDNKCDGPNSAMAVNMVDRVSSDSHAGVKPGFADPTSGPGPSDAKERNLAKITRIETNIDRIERMQEASYKKSHAELCDLEGRKGLHKQKLQDITDKSSRKASMTKERIDELENSQKACRDTYKLRHHELQAKKKELEQKLGLIYGEQRPNDASS
ncbi:MAG: hypothetical protein Q9180_003220 [Flavoplaca navasiana]